MPDKSILCPHCQSPYGYQSVGELFMCPECGHEWNPSETVKESDQPVVRDANGNVILDGDTVITIKNLPVRGGSGNIKAGTKIKNIKIVEGDHNIECRIDGFGAMALKSEFVKKA